MDFHQLREYRPGDSLRHIDWQTTTRSRKRIRREYQEERYQQMVFLMDCGRGRRAMYVLEEGWIAHFDQALNALFLLAFVALKQGDAAGVSTFAEPHPRLLAPRKGLAAHFQPEPAEPTIRNPMGASCMGGVNAAPILFSASSRRGG